MIVTNARCPRCGGTLMVSTIEYDEPPQATCLNCSRTYAELRPASQKSKGKRRAA